MTTEMRSFHTSCRRKEVVSQFVPIIKFITDGTATLWAVFDCSGSVTIS